MASIASSPESMAGISLSYLGRKEGNYVLKVARSLLAKVQKLCLCIGDDSVTADFLRVQLTGNAEDEAMYSRATFVVHTYIEIYETLSNRLSSSLTSGLRQYPASIEWVSGTCSDTFHREWRNRCAHNAGIPAPYCFNDGDALVNKGFDTTAFLEHLRKHLPPLITDLDKLVQLLEQYVESYPVLKPPEDHHKANETCFNQLLEERHPEILELQRKQDTVLSHSLALEQMKARVESGELDLHQQRAATIAKELKLAVQDAEQRAWAINARKFERAAKIIERRDALAPKGWTTDDAAAEPAGDWSTDPVTAPALRRSDVFVSQRPVADAAREGEAHDDPQPSTLVLVDTEAVYLAVALQTPFHTPPPSPDGIAKAAQRQEQVAERKESDRESPCTTVVATSGEEKEGLSRRQKVRGWLRKVRHRVVRKMK